MDACNWRYLRGPGHPAPRCPWPPRARWERAAQLWVGRLLSQHPGPLGEFQTDVFGTKFANLSGVLSYRLFMTIIANITLLRRGRIWCSAQTPWKKFKIHWKIWKLTRRSRVSFQIFQWVLKFFRGVWKPNSKSYLFAAWCLLVTPRHEQLQN